MRFPALTMAFLAPLAVSAEAPKKAVDYTNCNFQSNPYFEPTYRIGEDGSFEFKANDKRIISHSKSSDQEVLVAKVFWVPENQRGNQPDYKTKLALHKEGGRPAWIQMELDPLQLKNAKEALPKELAEQPVMSSSKTTFGYHGDKCYVKEISMKLTNGKEAVQYDDELCSSLLAAAKKATSKKLMECKATFSQMHDAIRKAKEKAENLGRDFVTGYTGSPFNIETGAQDIMKDPDWTAMMMVGSCNMTRAIYGHSMDPDVSSFGIGFAPFGGAFAPAQNDEPKSAPAK